MLSSLPVQLSLANPPSSPHATALYCSHFIFILCLHLSAPVLTPPPSSQFVSMAGSVFSADVPLVSSGLAGRQQK